jgi:hypothetical protein
MRHRVILGALARKCGHTSILHHFQNLSLLPLPGSALRAIWAHTARAARLSS